MRYRTLGKSALKVSELCLGCMTFGKNFYQVAQVDQKLATQMVGKALEHGINFFDTADVYSYGESEEILGRALRETKTQRSSVVIATKVRSAMSQNAAQGTGDVNNVGLSRKHIMEGCEASLRRLNTDYIDLYQVHGWDRLAPMEELLRALDDLVRQGKVLYVGCSNWSARHLSKAVTLARQSGLEAFVSLQAYYSLVGRDLEHELVPLCQEEGLGILPWSPLAGGFLTGKFRKGKEKPKDARRSHFDFPPINKEKAYEVVEALDQMAKEKGGTIAQIALKWLLYQPAVSSVIIGAKTMSQLEENLGAVEVELTQDDLRKLDELTAPPKLYPQWMIEYQNRTR